MKQFAEGKECALVKYRKKTLEGSQRQREQRE